MARWIAAVAIVRPSPTAPKRVTSKTPAPLGGAARPDARAIEPARTAEGKRPSGRPLPSAARAVMKSRRLLGELGPWAEGGAASGGAARKEIEAPGDEDTVGRRRSHLQVEAQVLDGV